MIEKFLTEQSIIRIGYYDKGNDEVKDAIKKHKALQLQLAIESYNKKKDYYKRRGLVNYAKEGTKVKVTKKRKEEL